LRRPTSGIPGQLTTGEGDALSVTIAPRGDEMVLVLHVDPGTTLDKAEDEMLLESITSRGLIRLRGTIERISDDLARFSVFTEPELIQRREFVRVTAPQRVRLDDLCGVILNAHSVNVSGGGMLVSARRAFEPDAELHFSLGLGAELPPLHGIGQIVRCSQDNEFGIVFTEISAHDRERLISFVFDRQRKALAFTRGDAI
jgi:hypothetical protein